MFVCASRDVPVCLRAHSSSSVFHVMRLDACVFTCGCVCVMCLSTCATSLVSMLRVVHGCLRGVCGVCVMCMVACVVRLFVCAYKTWMSVCTAR